MNIKGSCYFSYIHKQHVIIILSESDENNYCLMVPLSSIKFNENGKYKYKNKSCSYYDNSCIIEPNEIISNKGLNVIKKPTYALYKLADIINEKDIIKYQLNGILEYRCEINKNLLNRLQNGAMMSEFLEEHFKKYFDLF